MPSRQEYAALVVASLCVVLIALMVVNAKTIVKHFNSFPTVTVDNPITGRK